MSPAEFFTRHAPRGWGRPVDTRHEFIILTCAVVRDQSAPPPPPVEPKTRCSQTICPAVRGGGRLSYVENRRSAGGGSRARADERERR
ncbi:hypothetical protein EVAR_13060_1 [Eumeta japonica]|uniref:Uncharacterized protein n=1 Tax=Eumeta variegata TaxID=151549 RepID=A0A4C1VHE1_EUMVA|nr:hypothetical protein EVAR_13060_1 [Eumeta japonica]